MKKLCLVLIGILAFTPAWADSNLAALLNKVNLQLKVEKWVTTKTALVAVAVNASVTDKGIASIQNQVLNKLKQLSNRGEWHIVSFSRRKDKSGLESIQIISQARLPQAELANLRTKAKSLSKPGETFTISSVRFTPSDDELRAAKSDLRKKIYDQAKVEIDKLNNVYKDQKFYIHNIDFNSSAGIMPMAETAMFRSNKQMAVAVSVAPLNIGNKLNMYANVTLAAMPELLAKKSPLIN